MPPADEADALFTRWDTGHNGALSPAEFRASVHQLQDMAELQRLHEQFVAKDTDKNGCLNAAEYAHLTRIKNAGASTPPPLRLVRMPTHGDGSVPSPAIP